MSCSSLPAPPRLTPGQLGALIAVSVRELTWTLPAVAREVDAWHERARRIPDDVLRADALVTLKRERLNTEGAALFAILPRRRHRNLLRLLVAYQVLLDYLDSITERPGRDPLADGRQLHRALTEALDPGGPISDYFHHHDRGDDGGYLLALVRTCRDLCTTLPCFELVSAHAQRAARHGTVQILNHDPDPERRVRALVAFAEELPHPTDASWFELTAAASSSLWTLALLAFAAEPATTAADVHAAEAVYVPWLCAASTLLDAFVDQAEDAASGNHSYVGYYPTADVAVARVATIAARSAVGARLLRRGTRHALIATGMVAMYLSKDASREPPLRDGSRAILRAAGPLARIELVVMRVIRATRRLQSA